MIIQIDHIALATHNFKKSTQILSDLGYQNKFCEENKKNPNIKKDLVKLFSNTHNLSFFSKENNIGIELLDHFNSSGKNGYITPLFENLPEKFIEKKQKKGLFEFAMIKELNIPVYTGRNNKISGFEFNKFIVKTNQIEDSVNFWKCFGFKRTSLLNDFVVLEFVSPLQNNIYQIFLQQENCDKNYSLDDDGFNCIAFISSSSEKELLFLESKGLTATKIEQIEMNGKILKIFFVKGPNGELVEIVNVVETYI
jgi:hypothetical protein